MNRYRAGRTVAAAAAVTAGICIVGAALGPALNAASGGGDGIPARSLRVAFTAALYIAAKLIFEYFTGQKPSAALPAFPRAAAGGEKAAPGGARLFIYMLLALVGCVAASAVCGAALNIAGVPRESVSAVSSAAGAVAAVALHALAPAVIEELFFRGTLLPAFLSAEIPPFLASAFSALLFAAVHTSLRRMLPALAAGFILSRLSVRTRSAVPAVAVHFLYNSAVLLLALFF